MWHQPKSFLWLLGLVASACCAGPPKDGNRAGHGDDWTRKENWQVLSSDGKPLNGYPLSFDVQWREPHSPGQRCYIGVLIQNEGDLPIHIPISPVVTPFSNLWLTATRQGSGEEVTYGHSFSPEDIGKGYPPLIVVQPRKSELLLTWFVPWVAGEYECIVTFRNSEKMRTRDGWFKHEETGLLIRRRYNEFIPNVWVGECRFRVSPITTATDTVADSKTVAQHVTDRPPDVGYVFDLKGELDKLRATIAEYPLSGLVQVTQALDALVEMRHIFAVDTLVSLEKEARSALAVPDDELGIGNPFAEIIHSRVVNALHRIACNGAGYHALAAFASIAQDPNVGMVERALCVDILLRFEQGIHVRHGGRVVHIVTDQERRVAREALQRLRAAPEKVRKPIAWMLR